MSSKKWPLLGQILIALFCIGGLRSIIGGLSSQSVIDVIFGVAYLVIFWSIYKFKPWAPNGLTILLSLNILGILLNITGLYQFDSSMPPLAGIIIIAINGLIIYYFNSKKIKNLFLTSQ